jgi:hypothetical protein
LELEALVVRVEMLAYLALILLHLAKQQQVVVVLEEM